MDEREPIKTKFEWDDLNDPELVWPCDYCGALDNWPVCDDGATSSACNHCWVSVVQYCLNHDTD